MKSENKTSAVGTFHTADASLHIWREAADNEGVLKLAKAVRGTLYRRGWKLAPEARVARIIRKYHYLGRRGNLEVAVSSCGRHIEVGYFQNVANVENSNGGRYDFNKLSKMPYLLRLRTQFELRELAKYLARRGFLDRTDRTKFATPAEEIAYERSKCVHDYSPAARSRTACLDADGVFMNDGDLRYFRDFDGCLKRGQVFFNLNEMWKVAVPGEYMHQIHRRSLFAAARLPVRVPPAPLVKITKALERATKSLNFERAIRIRDAIERLTPLPTLTVGQRVRVDHPNFHGEGDVAYVKPLRVGVRISNGNVWEYELPTVRAAVAAPAKEAI